MRTEVFTKYLERIDLVSEEATMTRIRGLFRLFTLVLESLSEGEKIHFTSLFSRITYVGALLKMEGSLLFLFHCFRRGIEKELITQDNEQDYFKLGRFLVVTLFSKGYKLSIEQKVAFGELYRAFKPSHTSRKAFHQVRKGAVLKYKAGDKFFVFTDEEEGEKEYNVHFDVVHRNDIYTQGLEYFLLKQKFPLLLNLIDVDVQADGSLIPRAFVIEPDYLIDVTTIANSFKYYGTEPLGIILNKFRPAEMSIHLMIGNIANFILDELVNDPQIDFSTLMPVIFQSSPLLFSCLDDNNVMDVMKLVKSHYNHLRQVVNLDFKKEGIDTHNVYLEPSYYSQTYGIQGRLDLLHEHRDGKHYDIVELKSGSPFLPNNYGLSVQHYTQTLLYDLIVKSVYQGKKKTSNYILYSKVDERNLRNAPVLKVQQYEALKVRNEILQIEHRLMALVAEGNKNILHGVSRKNFPKAKGFMVQHIDDFYGTYSGLSLLEKAYFDHMGQFIAREHRFAKIGEHGLSSSNGLAALWREDKQEKEDRFAILYGLKILENCTASTVPLLHLAKTRHSPELAKFRKGDIVVLYPDSGPTSVLKSQIFKCNVIAIDHETITLKLKSRQYNQQIFNEYPYWIIEGDVMDSAFNTMYRSLLEWARSEPLTRRKILGMVPPITPLSGYQYHSSELTDEQNHLLNAMINAEDYYLLWGPPGTGKTSIMVKHLIKYLASHTDQKILLCAYTNRAVDELCEAVLSALEGSENPLLRVGSSHACSEKYLPYLLDQQMSAFNRREEVIQFLAKYNIIVSTVSSIINRVELFHLYKFDILIVDEASQILEPMLLGLMSRFSKWVLIGDHKQLPAVVVQPLNEAVVNSEALRSEGIINPAYSLFERLYHQCVNHGWNHAFGILTAQGRMHIDLMEFPNRHFYENRLKVIPSIARLSLPIEQESTLPTSRMVYIPSPIDQEFSWKTNRDEAEICRKLLMDIADDYRLLGKQFNPSSIGIITPYRAQIAMIKKKLPAVFKEVTVDTVERYQGGARDIIIISLCTNRLNQLDQLVSMSQEGIDRKLNVALTRGRERVFIIGNEEILSTDKTYRALLDYAQKVEIETLIQTDEILE